MIIPIRSALLAGMMLFLTSCVAFSQRYYSSEPIEAWVVDEQTKKPLEGVIVVAQWQLVRDTYHNRVPVGTMMILETVTDAKGKFSFPAWGPLENTTDGHLDHEDPLIYFFKPGYFLSGRSNDYAIPYSDKLSRRKWEWNGQTIALGLFPGTMEEYALHISSVSVNLLFPVEYEDRCHFRKTPLLAEAFDRENSSLEARGYRKGGFVFARLSPDSTAKCGVTRSSGEK